MEFDIKEEVPEGTPLYRPHMTRLGSGETSDGDPLVILKMDDNPVVGWAPKTAREIAKAILHEASLMDGKVTTVVERDP